MDQRNHKTYQLVFSFDLGQIVVYILDGRAGIITDVIARLGAGSIKYEVTFEDGEVREVTAFEIEREEDDEEEIESEEEMPEHMEYFLRYGEMGKA